MLQDLIEFDAYKFHETMYLVEIAKDNKEMERMETQIQEIRLW